MSKLTFRSIALSTLPLCLSVAAFAQSHPYVIFDAPDATAGTFPLAVSSGGQIAGQYVNISTHGFLRNFDGSIIEFDVPNVKDTYPSSINSKGQIVGSTDSVTGGHVQGFLRSANGHFSPIAYPGSTHTYAYSINDSSVTVGQYADSNFVFHGYLYDASGSFTSFDAPGAGTANGQGTSPIAKQYGVVAVAVYFRLVTYCSASTW